MTNIRTGKAFDDAPTMTRGGFLKGILASGIAPSITLATLANAESANASVGGMMRNVGARVGMMGGGGTPPVPPTIRNGVTLYLESVPANTTILGTTGRVVSTSSPVIVDWGDGSTDIIPYSSTMSIPAHTYSNAGNYEINVDGDTFTEIKSTSLSLYPCFTSTAKTALQYIKRLTFGDNLTGFTVGSNSFRLQPFETLYLCDGITSIGNQCFNGCSSLSECEVKEGVITIGAGFFNSASSLTTIKLPSTLISIGGLNSFYDCTNLSKIYCAAVNPPSFNNPFSGLFYNVDKTIPVYVPSMSISSYQSANIWSSFTNYKAI